MERAEIFINKVRENTNLTDRNGVKDQTVLMHYNSAQQTIQSIIYQSRIEPDTFVGTEVLTPAEVTADLPLDIYKDNAVLYVEPEGVVRKLDKIQSYERGKRSGYFLENKTIGFTVGLLNQYDSFAVKYFKRMPEIDIRRGLIASKTATTMTLTGGSTLLGTLSDWITVVDKNGVIIQREIRFVSFDSGTGVLTVDAVDADVAAGHYVVMGKIASSHCQLPDECEPFLLDYVQKKIRSKNTSKETTNQALFSEEQKADLIGLFQGNSSDAIYPPITDNDYP